MCLEVYANGIGEGAGTHCSVSIILLWIRPASECLPYTDCRYTLSSAVADVDGHRVFKVCFCQPVEMFIQVSKLNRRDRFCSHNSHSLYLVNDTLSLLVSYVSPCRFLIHNIV